MILTRKKIVDHKALHTVGVELVTRQIELLDGSVIKLQIVRTWRGGM